MIAFFRNISRAQPVQAANFLPSELANIRAYLKVLLFLPVGVPVRCHDPRTQNLNNRCGANLRPISIDNTVLLPRNMAFPQCAVVVTLIAALLPSLDALGPAPAPAPVFCPPCTCSSPPVSVSQLSTTTINGGMAIFHHVDLTRI